jgi:hypothetical protein
MQRLPIYAAPTYLGSNYIFKQHLHLSNSMSMKAPTYFKFYVQESGYIFRIQVHVSAYMLCSSLLGKCPKRMC